MARYYPVDANLSSALGMSGWCWRCRCPCPWTSAAASGCPFWCASPPAPSRERGPMPARTGQPANTRRSRRLPMRPRLQRTKLELLHALVVQVAAWAESRTVYLACDSADVDRVPLEGRALLAPHSLELSEILDPLLTCRAPNSFHTPAIVRLGTSVFRARLRWAASSGLYGRKGSWDI